MLIRLSVFALILFAATVGIFAQNEGKIGSDIRFENTNTNESKFSYGTIVRCYETTNSLNAFVQCLESSERNFDLETDRLIPPTGIPNFGNPSLQDNFGIPYSENQCPALKSFDSRLQNE